MYRSIFFEKSGSVVIWINELPTWFMYRVCEGQWSRGPLACLFHTLAIEGLPGDSKTTLVRPLENYFDSDIEFFRNSKWGSCRLNILNMFEFLVRKTYHTRPEDIHNERKNWGNLWKLHNDLFFYIIHSLKRICVTVHMLRSSLDLGTASHYWG